MTPLQINLAVARIIGWTSILERPGMATRDVFPRGLSPSDYGTGNSLQELPDFAKSIDAMHEALETLDDDKGEVVAYLEMLEIIFKRESATWFEHCHPKLEWQNEAFLRSFDKWEV